VEPQIAAPMQAPSKHSIVPIGLISQKIYFVRSTRVMLDADLARLYGVATKNLNKAVKRNASRFLSNFMFQLSSNEMRNLLRRKIAAMEKQYDARFQAAFATIRHMLETPVPAKKPIGFHAKPEFTRKSARTNGEKHK
jgi:ORF6N domain